MLSHKHLPRTVGAPSRGAENGGASWNFGLEKSANGGQDDAVSSFRNMTLKAVLLLLAALLGEIFSLHAQEGAAMTLKIAEQPDPPRLELQLRLPNPWTVQAIAASAGSQQFPVKFTAFGQGSKDTTAVPVPHRQERSQARPVNRGRESLHRTDHHGAR